MELLSSQLGGDQGNLNDGRGYYSCCRLLGGAEGDGGYIKVPSAVLSTISLQFDSQHTLAIRQSTSDLYTISQVHHEALRNLTCRRCRPRQRCSCPTREAGQRRSGFRHLTLSVQRRLQRCLQQRCPLCHHQGSTPHPFSWHSCHTISLVCSNGH